MSRSAFHDRNDHWGAVAEYDHPRVVRIAATLWAVSFTLGLVVYAALYVVPW
ncbi:hypothetical protein [Halorhabdus tiamatea]|uniref:hypothetical protein n=1 Tax=Halorhabdus tiamatea TaxID=430914 RepID=UPI0002122C09|nr:hypothetical protein [Halorhabdus tiamatea]